MKRKPEQQARHRSSRGQDDATNDRELQELRAKLPQDTRTLSARLLGDPLVDRLRIDVQAGFEALAQNRSLCELPAKANGNREPVL